MLIHTTRCILCVAFLAASASLFTRADAPRLEQMVTANLNDLQAMVTVVKAEQSELDKISRDYGMAYRLKDLTMRYKEPNKLRMENRIGLLIFNGTTRLFKVPQLGIKKKDDQGNAPGKRHSLMDIGLLSKSGVTALQWKFLRENEIDGVPVYVFDISYRGDDTAHYIVYIEKETRVILKREWFDAAGKLRATFSYQDAKEIQPGIWIPTRLEIRNSDGAVAGVTAYSDLKVNQGLDDALFEIS